MLDLRVLIECDGVPASGALDQGQVVLYSDMGWQISEKELGLRQALAQRFVGPRGEAGETWLSMNPVSTQPILWSSGLGTWLQFCRSKSS